MKFLTIKPKLQMNTELLIKPNRAFKFASIRIASSSTYRIEDSKGKVVDVGPSRTAKGYARAKHYSFNDPNFKIILIYYGIPTFEFADEDFFFGIELLDMNGDVIATTYDFDVFKNIYHINESSKFSFQRAFIERYNTSLSNLEKLTPVEANKITLLDDALQVCKYNEIIPEFVSKGDFPGFKSIIERKYLNFNEFKNINKYDVKANFEEETKFGYKFQRFVFDNNYTGLIRLMVKTNAANKVFATFDEFLPDDEFAFGRANVSNLIEITFDKSGEYFISSNVCYTLKHILILSKEEIDVSPSLVLVQNDLVKDIELIGNDKVDLINKAATRTFKQNSFDIFTDCPSRERSGWLCDSYFSGLCEKFYTGNNRIEKSFLENIILSNDDYLPRGMVPMCYPSNYVIDKIFIPNWSLWFIVEVKRYFDETNDKELLIKAKDKIYGILNYFSEFENEHSLLENLESWVFVEWSLASSDEYLKGINFPTNMLYSGALKCTGELYNDQALIRKAQMIKDKINDFSFNGLYYVDNALNDNSKIIRFNNHISEVCQYYALFFEINESKAFAERMKIVDVSLSPCAVFIGKFLRLLWLYEEKEYEIIKNEFVDYFYFMAKDTGTLWEKYIPEASCNHGFASVLGMYLYNVFNK